MWQFSNFTNLLVGMTRVCRRGNVKLQRLVKFGSGHFLGERSRFLRCEYTFTNLACRRQVSLSVFRHLDPLYIPGSAGDGNSHATCAAFDDLHRGFNVVGIQIFELRLCNLSDLVAGDRTRNGHTGRS